MTEDEISKSLADREDRDLVDELAWLTDDFVNQCSRLMREGKDPGVVLNRKPGCAFEKVALQIATDVVRVGNPCWKP